MPSDSYKKIYAAVKRIPKGKVATYGQIAELAGLPNGARQVGYALSALDEDDDNEAKDNDQRVPWQRVINARGEISARWDPSCENRQLLALRDEGVLADENGKISLAEYRWQPRSRNK